MRVQIIDDDGNKVAETLLANMLSTDLELRIEQEAVEKSLVVEMIDFARTEPAESVTPTALPVPSPESIERVLSRLDKAVEEIFKLRDLIKAS